MSFKIKTFSREVGQKHTSRPIFSLLSITLKIQKMPDDFNQMKLILELLTLSWRRILSYGNHSIDLRSKWTGFYMIETTVINKIYSNQSRNTCCLIWVALLRSNYRSDLDGLEKSSVKNVRSCINKVNESRCKQCRVTPKF